MKNHTLPRRSVVLIRKDARQNVLLSCVRRISYGITSNVTLRCVYVQVSSVEVKVDQKIFRLQQPFLNALTLKQIYTFSAI